MNKKIVLPILGLLLLGGTFFGVSQVSAQGSRFSGLAQMIAQKFGLDQTQVQSVVDQYSLQQSQNMQQKMQQGLQSRLDAQVKSGKITSAQKQAILTELATLRNKYNPSSFKNMTADQRKQAMQNEQTDLKSWAASAGIDISLIPGINGFGRGINGMHKGWAK